MKTRNCECCKGEYATGSQYGEYSCILSNSGVETKGLCEWCNPSNTTWYVPGLKCHATLFYKLLTKCPYWVRRFDRKTDGLTLTNWQYVQYSLFGRWSKIETQLGFIGSKSFTFRYKALDKEKYKRETNKCAVLV